MNEFVSEGLYHLCSGRLYRIRNQYFWAVVDILDEQFRLGLREEVQWAIDHNQVNIPSFNQLYGISIEAILTNIEAGRFGSKKAHYRKVFHFFIFETLQRRTTSSRAISQKEDGTTIRRRNCYDQLVDYCLDMKDDNHFITFNYDLLADEAICRSDHRILCDYNVPFISAQQFTRYERKLKGHQAKKEIDLLKLHGSLNWMQCSQCSKYHLAYHIDYGKIANVSCKCCKKPLRPVLIAPAIPKGIDKGCFPALWNKAEKCLSMADEIVVVGYSFPQADLEAITLFKTGLLKREKKPKLIVVDPKEEAQDHIQRICNIRATEEYPTFECYCNALVQRKRLAL